MFFSPFDNFMFTIIPFIVVVGFLFVFGSIIASAIKAGIERNNNNQSPIFVVDALVVSKRMSAIRGNIHHNSGFSSYHSPSVFTYLATFEVESGDRMELEIPEKEYGLIAEHDFGRLTFQGTKYIKFERE
ncbi:MAG: DUF2500 domain-containing protein [Eubacteriaceae bacterium]|nr:DUF2500 domain-containing protein [Eubacteriaceae bacterium]